MSDDLIFEVEKDQVSMYLFTKDDKLVTGFLTRVSY